MTALIEVENLRKRFGPLTAVDGVSFCVARGEVLGFLGPNGAGKSTTMRILAGSLAASSGSARICGFDTGAPGLPAKAQTGYLPEGSPLYGEMTPEALLDFVARARGMAPAARRKRVAEVIERLELGDALRRAVDTLSKGFKRRLGLALALVHDPRVLILDEPTDGLDPNQKQSVRGLIAEISRDKAIIVSTHLLEEVDSLCTRAIIISSGKIAGGGTPEELRRLSPRHNAAHICVGEPDAGRAAALLLGLPGVAGVERRDAEGSAALTALARDGAFIADAAAGALRGASIGIRSLDVEAGRLDDVFHRLTRGAPAHAA